MLALHGAAMISLDHAVAAIRTSSYITVP
jgi:hypothetical protein